MSLAVVREVVEVAEGEGGDIPPGKIFANARVNLNRYYHHFQSPGD